MKGEKGPGACRHHGWLWQRITFHLLWPPGSRTSTGEKWSCAYEGHREHHVSKGAAREGVGSK